MNPIDTKRLVVSLAGILLVTLVAGCGSSNRLHYYHFENESVAALAAIPPRPVVFSSADDAWIDLERPILSILRVGTAIAKEVQLDKAQVRLDSAFQMVRFSEIMAAGVLDRGADYLGYAPVSNPRQADFLIDLRVDEYGILADSWENSTYFVVQGELLMLDNHTNEIIWKKRVRDRELITDEFFLGTTIGNVMTARMLSALSVEDMVVGLERLADGAAYRLSHKLMRDYAHARR